MTHDQVVYMLEFVFFRGQVNDLLNGIRCRLFRVNFDLNPLGCRPGIGQPQNFIGKGG